LAVILERAVHLFLHVKVMRGWAEDRRLYGEVGLDFDV
jgi:GTP-binding protein Era